MANAKRAASREQRKASRAAASKQQPSPSKDPKTTVDRHYKWIRERIEESKGHVDDAQKLLNDILDEKLTSLPKMASRVLTIGLSCFDAAMGWLRYPPK
jgi:hypothetical protein